MRTVRQVVQRIRRVPPRELATTAHAGVVLVVVEASIRWTRLPRLARWCGVDLDLTPIPADADPMPLSQLTDRDRRALRAARRATAVWPFCDGPCLRRALVGGHLIRHLNPAMRIGVAPAHDTIRAHAWLEIGGRPLEAVDDYRGFERLIPEDQRARVAEEAS